MDPTRTSLTSSASAEDGEIVKPEHIGRAILGKVGITEDVADYRADPLTALYA